MHTPAPRRLLCTFVALLSLLLTAPGAVADDAESDLVTANKRIAELEAQVRQLTAQLALVQKELTHAPASVDAPADRTPATQPSASTAAAGLRPNAGATTKPSSPYRSALDLLTQLPAALRPGLKTPWEPATRRQAVDYLNEHAFGRPFETTVTLRSVNVHDNHDRKPGDGSPEWIVVYQFETTQLAFQERDISQTLRSVTKQDDRLQWWYRMDAFYTEVDEATAVRAKALPKGAKLRLTGRIQNITLDLVDTTRKDPEENRYNLHLYIAAPEIHSPLLDR
ncbi:MAG: hypothetical protein K8S99_09610 [Planctomycetes bacterium]|nr:hypothetical protein [Planctomycetota bacterium]